MKLQAQAQTRLHELMLGGTLPASQCGQTFLKLLEPLLDSGVLEWARGGAGRRLVVKDIGALSAFYRGRFPQAQPSLDASNRVAGVGRFRDTKAMASNENEIVTLRAWRDEAILKNGKPCGAAAATVEHGVFSFLLTPESPYQLRGSCALVENPAVFAVAEQLNLSVGLMVYGHGRISSRLADWLARPPAPDFRLLHLPDYDPTGLSEFQRLQSRLGEHVVLHEPADLEERFARFSNRSLLEKKHSQKMLALLRGSNSPPIRRVVALIDRNNAGLEQEALLVKLRS